MAVQITSDNFEQYFSEYFENYFLNTYSEHSSALENDEGEARGADVIVDQAGMDATLALPGVRYDKPVVVGGQVNNEAKAEAYVQIPWAVLIQALNILQGDAEVIMLDWNGDGTEEHPGLKTQVNAAIVGAERVTASLSGSTLTVVDRNGTPYSVNTAAASEAAAAEWTNTYKPDIVAKTSAAQAATTGAERVNAQLDGMTVTITNRQGVSKSTNIGFEVYRTYSSVAAMNADAANVPQGKFVIIATTDATDPDNAKLYAKNSQGGFTFLSDLDQASSAAWADWLDNMKPQIESAISTADSDHTRAGQDHQTATQDHTTAQSDHTQATADHTQAGTDHTTAVSDHNKAVADHTTADADHTTAQSDHSTASTDHTRAVTDHNTATQDHTTAGQDHTRAESDHTRAEQDHTRAGQDHQTAQSDHTTATSDHNNYTADRQTFQANEAQRQQTFETNEATRQQDFEDAEADRMAAMVITRCFVDFSTMHLLFVQPEADTTQYKVRNGNLNITITYDE